MVRTTVSGIHSTEWSPPARRGRQGVRGHCDVADLERLRPWVTGFFRKLVDRLLGGAC